MVDWKQLEHMTKLKMPKKLFLQIPRIGTKGQRSRLPKLNTVTNPDTRSGSGHYRYARSSGCYLLSPKIRDLDSSRDYEG